MRIPSKSKIVGVGIIVIAAICAFKFYREKEHYKGIKDQYKNKQGSLQDQVYQYESKIKQLNDKDIENQMIIRDLNDKIRVLQNEKSAILHKIIKFEEERQNFEQSKEERKILVENIRDNMSVIKSNLKEFKEVISSLDNHVSQLENKNN
ncbi:unnamed protein product [Paramecium octaurelia]|uniref:Uncharacterized protein n=1 Tax=Paramecium octaurelia TaxID=43137 RepID=A0A8S1VY54_PAROT|nr:unnamed protein product [Paramecium octaurelia]